MPEHMKFDTVKFVCSHGHTHDAARCQIAGVPPADESVAELEADHVVYACPTCGGPMKPEPNNKKMTELLGGPCDGLMVRVEPNDLVIIMQRQPGKSWKRVALPDMPGPEGSIEAHYLRHSGGRYVHMRGVRVKQV